MNRRNRMKVLFICNMNKHRSKTAEEIFRDRYETKSAGLFNDTPVSAEQLGWADIILVMEESQRKELTDRFPSECLKKRILCLGIPDVYPYGDPELVSLLESRVGKAVESPDYCKV